MIKDDFEPTLSTNSESKFDAWLKKYMQKEYLAEIKTLKQIAGTNGFFYEGGLHLVHGLAKQGKTYVVLELLNGVTDKKVLWLDGDQNGKDMAERYPNIIHMPPLEPNARIASLVQENDDLKNVIIVIDSLKDYSVGEEPDSNTGSNNIMQFYKKLNRLGATVVVVHHSTPSFEKGEVVAVKLKGNSEGIRSNADIVYLFEHDWDAQERSMTAETSRVAGMPNGTKKKYTALAGWHQVAITSNSESKDAGKSYEEM